MCNQQNLIQLYRYDSSEFDGHALSQHGLYPYKYLDHQWTDEYRHPFLIKIDEEIAGFIFVLTGVPKEYVKLSAANEINVISDFFIIPKFRRRNYGKQAAFYLLTDFLVQGRLDKQKEKERKMSVELKEIKQKLKETRDELLGIVKALNGDQLSKRKEANSWTISQVCQHLIKTEELYVTAIKKGIKSTGDSFSENIPQWELLVDRSNKIEAPDIAKPDAEALEGTEIIEKLNHSREKLNEVLNTIEDPSLLSRRHFVHPVFKEMSLIDWVKSLYLHEQRHIKQIIEIKDGI
ncbi:DinB family protein [Paenibacillus thiaminolyticus]|uniref:DinB family protein n=1 Tax=Paenibacillus thiaminolyticus TaxID=49283 RepID=UPI00232D12AD|nr:DinB family protein [Paenibacillus thiaminolyticus]WCF10627.1 DinB family protein [Paenibacillus thiaminolyticus]